ncbi:DNA processing protein [Saccharopolyspora antimicrobica]|uniref:DNA processing protein n=1 Tax=Saccharopolyspora antimicrobica TaxID=455193 RepID=A0A1I4T304_9PSEU|nr:DNA-processing protein DprA [Saccharopolyspora antimicrobica]RKT85898.1 DNA processing protein [Saccharopolyspora antimicrobica]SFM70950.1 DNA processing protein [Saccharopolyspora antimicrobica]
MENWVRMSEKGRHAVRLARAFLAAIAEPPAPALAGFVARHGACRAVEVIQRGKAPPDVLAEIEARYQHVSAEELLEATEAAGAQLVVPEEPGWPGGAVENLTGAREVGLPEVAEPIALWVRGRADLAAVLDQAVSVVGARAASGYGEHVAAEFGHGLANAGFTVVSGAAYGIDGAAHRGALAAGGRTVAFLACGVDIDYPAGHSRLLRAVAEQGAVVSEYPPGTAPRKHRFLVRNRLIAAAGRATVVVEAGARSGAGNTANTADALGRPVLAVPGPVTAKNSVGCHGMVRSGQAVLVTSVEQVMEVVSPLGVPGAVEAVGTRRRTDGLHPRAQRLHDSLRGMAGASAEDLARDCGLPLGEVRALLPELELSGFAVRTDRGWSIAR